MIKSKTFWSIFFGVLMFFIFNNAISAKADCTSLNGWTSVGSSSLVCQGEQLCTSQYQEYLTYSESSICTSWESACSSWGSQCVESGQCCTGSYSSCAFWYPTGGGVCDQWKQECISWSQPTCTNVCTSYNQVWVCTEERYRCTFPFLWGSHCWMECIAGYYTDGSCASYQQVCVDGTCTQYNNVCIHTTDITYTCLRYETVCYLWEACCVKTEQVCNDWTSICTGYSSQCLPQVTGSQTVYTNCSYIDGQCDYVANNPPSQPGIPAEYLPDGISWQHCTFVDQSLPTFHWTYSDPDSDLMAAYEIEIDDNAAFQAPKFNHLANVASVEYNLNLRQDDEDPDNLPPSMQDYVLDWNATYFWHVRVKDSKGAWSSWSQTQQFKTPQAPYPYSGFTWEPQEPNINEVIVFTPDDLTASAYLWEITSGSGEFVDGTTAASQIPHIKLTSTANSIQLTATDAKGSCSQEEDLTAWYPLPKYKEVRPSLIFDPERLLSVISSLVQTVFR